ncbi:hypothetical protein [Streptomyces mobaraensis]|uniref:Uncharacterized protein n=1 Tax=Streptomyces mobaraensis TaxID=35621 RepID=A0A5N5W3U7_STRMB|nr:hypothetical protein [Streptomyces mobaraensis]KAB7839480.1 hypothetical protein FRZ00_21295 [Streptomyces mobaraensis]
MTDQPPAAAPPTADSLDAEASPPQTSWRIQTLYPTGWGTADASYTWEYALALLARRRHYDPDLEHRLVQQTITYTVVEEPPQ